MLAARMIHVCFVVFVLFVAFAHIRSDWSSPAVQACVCWCGQVCRLSQWTSDAVDKQWFRSVCRHWSHFCTAHDTRQTTSRPTQLHSSSSRVHFRLFFRRCLCLIITTHVKWHFCSCFFISATFIYFLSFTAVEGRLRTVYRVFARSGALWTRVAPVMPIQISAAYKYEKLWHTRLIFRATRSTLIDFISWHATELRPFYATLCGTFVRFFIQSLLYCLTILRS